MRVASIVLAAYLALISSGCKTTGTVLGFLTDGIVDGIPFNKEDWLALEQRREERKQREWHKSKDNPQSVSEQWARERAEEEWKQHWRDNPHVNPHMTEAFADQ